MKKLHLKNYSLYAGAVFAALLLLTSFSCKVESEPQKLYGHDADYFMGLKLLDEGTEESEKEARNMFVSCMKKGTEYCGQKSAEKLCSIGTVDERNKAAIKLYNKYDNPDAHLFAVEKLKSTNELHKLIECTNNIDFKEDYNATIRIRIESLRNRNDNRYEDEVFKWFISRKITDVQYKFYKEFYNHPDFGEDFEINIENINKYYAPEQFIMNYRIETYNRNYPYTYRNGPKLIEYLSSHLVPLSEEVASDLGKAYLYGSKEYLENAKYFETLAEQFKDTDIEYYFWFYAGRLYSKTDSCFEISDKCFEKAISCTKDEEKIDNALWYMLNTSLNYPIDRLVENIDKYSKRWTDPAYFDDFFETLLLSLLTAGRWDAFQAIYKYTDGYASDETVAQYAYIYGRLVQEGLARGTDTDVKEAFTRALNGGYSIYYKALAAKQLDLSESELEKVLCKPYGMEDKEPDVAAEKLLTGYAYFGFPKLIFPEWEKLYENGLSTKTSLYLANFLMKCAAENDIYYNQSLRIAAKIIANTTQPLPKEDWKLIYPKDYSNLIENFCTEFNVEPSVAYGLVRSESFFNARVSSVAGAKGLAQLMDTTAEDIARKFKKESYSLLDPETNLQFGIYYLSELIERSDNSILSACFAYNAGINRVRRWKKDTLINVGAKSTLPMDLFLETLPYSETREYGRKILSSAVMYEWLYSDTPKESFNRIIEKLLL